VHAGAHRRAAVGCAGHGVRRRCGVRAVVAQVGAVHEPHDFQPPQTRAYLPLPAGLGDLDPETVASRTVYLVRLGSGGPSAGDGAVLRAMIEQQSFAILAGTPAQVAKWVKYAPLTRDDRSRSVALP
jgi:hypothetical protein